MYHYRSDNGKPPRIYWNGKDNANHDVAIGTYFFHVDVHFDVLDPQKKRKSYKGWVQLIR
jgi:hypothetical protein